MYAMMQIRPNIYYIVFVLSRYNNNSNSKHIAIIKRVIRYLKNTLNYEITYDTETDLVGYTNVDWAADQETRRSLKAYVFLLHGGAVN